jgi:hypothetical protein
MYKHFLPLLAGIVLLVASRFHSGTVYLGDETFALPVNGQKAVSSYPLNAGTPYTVTVSSSEEITAIYWEGYLYPRSDILFGNKKHIWASRTTPTSATFSYSGTGEPLSIHLATDHSSDLKSLQVSVHAETLAEQWSRQGLPPWLSWILAILFLCSAGMLLAVLYRYWDRYHSRRTLEIEAARKQKQNARQQNIERQKQYAAQQLEQTAKALLLQARRESRFVDRQTRERYARARHREILEEATLSVASIREFLRSLSDEYRRLEAHADIESSYSLYPSSYSSSYGSRQEEEDRLKHFKKHHPEVLALLKSASAVATPGTLREQWSRQYDEIMLNDKLLALLKREEYGEVLQWLEGRQETIKLAEVYSVEGPKPLTREELREDKLKEFQTDFEDQQVILSWVKETMEKVENERLAEIARVESDVTLSEDLKKTRIGRLNRIAEHKIHALMGEGDEEETVI